MSNVSEITQHLISIVAANDELQDVWLQGKISNVRHIRNGPLNFTLKDSNEKIDCVIFDNGTSFQTNLPSEGSGVYVKGQIFIYGTSSEYRFKVTDIKLSENPLPDQSVSVADLTEVLENTIADPLVEVQGQISDIYEAKDNDWVNFKIKNATTDEIPNDIIECSLPPSIANNLPFPLTEGEEVSVKGNFKIFSSRNTYQIVINNTTDIERVPDPPAGVSTSRCNECGQSHDTNYELCPMCHYAQVEHEGIVVGAVMRYFDEPRFANFSTRREYPIRLIGTIEGRADVVLLDSENRLSVIAECKRIRYDGNEGIDQLKSYLFPSESKLGLFADDTDPNKWTFLKNLGRRNFAQITRTEFEALVDQGIPSPPIPENSASRLWQYIIGVLGVALCICLTVLIMQLDEKNRQIQQYTYNNLKLENENQELQKQITAKDEQIQNSPQTISQLQNENKTLVSENQSLQKQITEKDKQIQNNTSTVLKLESENKTLVSENQSLQKQITENEKEIESLVTKNKKLERKIEEWESLRNGSHTPKTLPPDNPPILLNINTASIEELQTLPGIGPAKAQSIFNYREKHGKFVSVDDITKVSGIGEKTLENLRKFISTE